MCDRIEKMVRTEKNVSGKPFDIVRDIEKARKTIEEKGGTPRVFYISRKQYEILSEQLRTSGWLKEGQDGKEYVLGTELMIWDDLIPERK